jgi:hypothetical protein
MQMNYKYAGLNMKIPCIHPADPFPGCVKPGIEGEDVLRKIRI